MFAKRRPHNLALWFLGLQCTGNMQFHSTLAFSSTFAVHCTQKFWLVKGCTIFGVLDKLAIFVLATRVFAQSEQNYNNEIKLAIFYN